MRDLTDLSKKRLEGSLCRSNAASWPLQPHTAHVQIGKDRKGLTTRSHKGTTGFRTTHMFEAMLAAMYLLEVSLRRST
jgi:hypothetical protein